jgi:glycerophosphoryl diester phosphodiesterase
MSCQHASCCCVGLHSTQEGKKLRMNETRRLTTPLQFPTVARQVLRTLKQSWRELLYVTLLYRALAFIVLWPLAGVVLKLVIATSGEQVVADEDIVGLVLSPVGFTGLVIAGSVIVTVAALEQVCIVIVVFSRVREHTVHTISAVRTAVVHALPVLKTVVRGLLICTVLALPFLAGAGLVYVGLLGKYDINFYLSERPPAFIAAVTVGGGLAIGMAAMLIPRLLGWLCALPMLLFESTPAATVLAQSSARMHGNRWNAFWLLVTWGGAAFLFGGVNLSLVLLIATWIIPPVSQSLPAMIVVLGLLALLLTFGNLAISVLQSATFGVCLTRIYLNTAANDAVPKGKLTAIEASAESKPGRLTRRRIIWGMVTLLVCASTIGAILINSVRIDENVIVIAHRGAAGSAPENTLASVQQAIVEHAEVVEIDVQETSDGEVVVIHDSDLMKIAGENLKIWDATLPQLASIDIGSHFDVRFKDERVPTLRQVLEVCRDQAVVDIELKYYGHDEDLERRVADIVEACQMEQQVILMSLKYDAVKQMKSLRPDWTVGLLTATAVGDLTSREADFLAVNAAMCTAAFVNRAHRNDKKVYVWTINNPVDVSRYASFGVDGVITDFPGRARQVLNERDRMNPLERLLVHLAFRIGIVPPQLPSTAEMTQ